MFIYCIINVIKQIRVVVDQYAVTVALNHEEIKEDPQGITKIKPFINKCNWEKIKFPSEKK